MPTKSLARVRRVREALTWAERRLRGRAWFGHGTACARDEAAWLLAAALAVAPDALAQRLEEALPGAARARLAELVQRRIRTRAPAAYLLREAWFAGLPFYVDERVLVPRSLTAEFIEERFAPWIAPERVRRILDLGTGSGCMAIAAARAFPAAAVDAADVSAPALEVARINVERHGVGDRVRLVHSDIYAALGGARYDVILTNPPYVADCELARLPPEYGHEPRIALAAGERGLDLIVRILAGAAAHLAPGGLLLAEVGNARGALESALPEVPFVWLETASGDDGVFLLTAEQAAAHARRFLALEKEQPRSSRGA